MVHAAARASGRILVSLALGLALVSFAAPVAANAQSGTVSGTVVDSKSGRPLADARVAVEGSAATARTGVRGDFRLANLSGTTVRIFVTRIGYQAQTVTASVGATDVEIKLVEQVVKLDELVVTGTAGEQTKRSLGNAVGGIDVASTLAVAGPPAKIQDLLSVNVPGVRVIRASGAIGTGGTTRIRGSGSLSLSNEPLVYVDGIRVDNSSAVNSYAFQAQEAPSRINDLNPEDIESIEVLKGPSAATIYGTEASNGVINIITKRGRAGRPTFDVHLDAGANWIMDPEGRYESNYYYSPTAQEVREFNVLKFNRDNGFPSPFRTGTPLAVGVGLSGGSEQLRYYVSADANRDEGPVEYNWQNKFNGRANVTYSTSDDKFKVDVSLGATRSKLSSASSFQPITTSILWACNFPGCEPDPSDPDNTGWNDEGHGYQFYRPEDYSESEGLDFIDRTTFSVQVNHRPFNWLRHRLTIGPDFVNNKSSNLTWRHATARRPFFDQSEGARFAQQQRSTFITVDYGASADFTVGNLVSTTSVGAQYYSKEFDVVNGSGQFFAIPGPGNINSGSTILAGEQYLQNKTFGVYAQEQVAFKNRFFLTGAVRADGNSAFGANFDAVYYPKVSFSWVLSDEPFMANSSFFSQFKLRGAWGRAGLQPDVFFAIQTYQPVIGNGGQGGVTPQNLGNIDLKPEVGEEIETGFDAGFFDNRIGLEFTYYNKKTKDAILSLPIKPSRGFPGNQFVNIGETQNKGIEIALDGSPFNKRNFGLDLRATLATNDSKITDMGGTPSAFVGSSFIQQFNVEGFAPNSFFFKKVVSSDVQTFNFGIPLPVGTNVMCEGGTDLGEGDGTVVPCSSAPRLFAGRPTPSWNGSFSATFRIGQNLRILGLVDYLGGSNILVGDVAAIHAFFLSSKQVLEGTDEILSGYLGLQFFDGDPNAVGAVGMFKGGFAKLRTVSATYDFPNSLARWFGASRGSITLAAENFWTFWREQKESYGVRWIDPEIVPNRVGDVTGNFGYTQESWPQLARIRTTFRFTF
ncbi:MAG: SusC/RagA family TonB-linked outer membrane protein [Gemmatimonadales bacterium]